MTFPSSFDNNNRADQSSADDIDNDDESKCSEGGIKTGGLINYPGYKQSKRQPRRLSWAADLSNDANDANDANEVGGQTHSTHADTSLAANSNNNALINRVVRRRSMISTPSVSLTDEGAAAKNKMAMTIKSPLLCMQDDHIDSNTILEQKSSRAVWCLRVLTLSTLSTAAMIVAVCTYIYSRNAEMQVFEIQYQDSVVKVSEAIALDISNKLNTAMSFSAMYTSRYGPENSWPNVTMPNFQQQAKGQLKIADGIALSYNPIITNETRKEWEAYAANSAHLLGEKNLLENSCKKCRIVKDGIFRKVNKFVVNDTGVSAESRYPYHMVPVWQIYPTKQNWKAVMFNLHSEINRQRALDDMLEHEVPTITGLLKLVQHTKMDPSSILFYPVFNHFQESGFFKKVEGSISIVFTWADILQSVLPAYIKGLIVVLENSVTDELDRQLFTYSVSGKEVTLLGEGDMHDASFDMFKHEVLANVAQGMEGLDDVDHLITYKLTIYPSKVFQSQYLTSRPLTLTLAIVLIFVVTSTVFLLYDYLVNHRQNAITEFAQRSGRIVNSMFPSGFRERLFTSTELLGRQSICDVSPKQNDGDSTSIGTRSSKRPTTYYIKQFLGGNLQKAQPGNDKNDVQSYIQNTPPIANLFHNTTILFADMVSFTAWSSNHSPEDVFYLLETLFLEFDKVAKRKGVFKLGTIGKNDSFDEYIATCISSYHYAKWLLFLHRRLLCCRHWYT